MAVAGYEYRVDGGSPVDVGNVLVANVTGLTPDTAYNFEVRAYDAAGNRSAWSPIVTARTIAAFPTANLILDVEPNAFGLADGASIVSLDNSIGGQNDGTQATGANRATYHTNQQNGYGAAQLDGVNDSYDFGNIFASLTQGSIYLYGKKTNDPSSSVLKDGVWQTEIAGGDVCVLGQFASAVTNVTERIFKTASSGSNVVIGEPSLSDKFFLYEVHNPSATWENILNTVQLQSSSDAFHASDGFLFGTSFACFFEGSFVRLLAYSAAHDESTRAAVRANIQARYAADILDHKTTNLVFVGDSITYSFPYSKASGGDEVLPYPNRTLVNLGGGNYFQNLGTAPPDAGELMLPYNRRFAYFGRNRGVSGYHMTDLISHGTDIDAYLQPNVENILVILAGTNDLSAGSTDAAGLEALTTTYCNSRRSAGWDKLAIGTLLHRVDVDIEVDRIPFNSWLRLNFSSFADILIDFAADSRLSDASNVTYFADNVHPTPAGYEVMGQIAAAALTA